MNIKQISLQHMGFWTLHPEALNQSEKCVGKIFDKITACKNSELKKKKSVLHSLSVSLWRPKKAL